MRELESGHTLHEPMTWRGRLLVAALTVAIAVFAALSVRNEVRFETPLFWALPDWINFCGHNYNRSTEIKATQASLLAQTPGGEWRTVDRTLTRRPITVAVPAGVPTCAEAPSDATFAEQIASTVMTLYIKTGEDEFRTYSMSGGP